MSAVAKVHPAFLPAPWGCNYNLEGFPEYCFCIPVYLLVGQKEIECFLSESGRRAALTISENCFVNSL